MTTLAPSTGFDLPRLGLPHGRRWQRPVPGGDRLASALLMVLGALLLATVLYTAGTVLTGSEYTVVAQTIVEQDGQLLTVYEGRY